MQKELKDILDGNDPSRIDSGVLFKRVMENLDDLSQDAIGEALIRLPPDAQLKITQRRCKQGDNLACTAYDVAIHGDPGAPPGSPRYMGIAGQCDKGNKLSCETLEELGEL